MHACKAPPTPEMNENYEIHEINEPKNGNSNAESAVVDELYNERPRAPRDWTREAHPAGNGNLIGENDGLREYGGIKGAP